MKKSCEVCGKVFNMEDHLYICPKCNHYHSQVRYGKVNNVEYKMPRQLDIGKSGSPKNILDAGTDGLIGRVKSVLDKIKNKKVIAIIIIVLLIAPGIIGSIYDFASDKANQYLNDTEEIQAIEEEKTQIEAELLDEEMDIQYYTAGKNETMHLSEFAITAEMKGEVDLEGVTAPEGMKFIRADFENDLSDADYESESIRVYFEYDDMFFIALDPYDFTDDTDIENRLYDEGLETDPSYTEKGFFLFLVPEDADAGNLKFYGSNGYDDIYEVYTIPVEI